MSADTYQPIEILVEMHISVTLAIRVTNCHRMLLVTVD